MGVKGFWGCFLFCFSFATLAKAGAFSPLPVSIMAAAMVTVTERHVDNEYAARLHIDPHVTVALTSTGAELCTGTFLSDTEMLTAGHCLEEGDPTGGVNVDGVPSLAAYVAPQFKDIDSARYDMALVIFPAGTGEYLGIQHYPRLASAPPAPGEALYLVGFGMTDPYAMMSGGDGGHGIRGWGITAFDAIENGLIRTRDIYIPYSKTAMRLRKIASNILVGDSGGAVYNERGEIVGVVSLVNHRRLQLMPKVISQATGWSLPYGYRLGSKFVWVNSADSQALLRRGRETEKYFIEERVTAAQSVNYRDFPLHTGFYFQSGRSGNLYVRPAYFQGEVVRLDLADLSQPDAPILRLRCRVGLVCTDWYGEHEVIISPNTVTWAQDVTDTSDPFAEEKIIEHGDFQFQD